MDSTDLNDIFLDENYSIKSLLTQTNDLDKLRNSLVEHKQNLNQNLLDLFNNSYDKFYKLSYSITRISEPIQHLIEPTQNFKTNLGDLCKLHDSYIDDINNKLAALEDANKNKELAKQLVQLIKRRNRIEVQMDSIDWSVKGPTYRLKNRNNQDADYIKYQIKCDLMERVNIELFYLTSEIRSLQPTHDELITIKKSLESCLERRQSQIDNWFDEAFLLAISNQNEVMIDLVLRTYKQKGSTSRLGAVWRDKVAKPYLNIAITESQLENRISQTYEDLNLFIRRQLDLIKGEFITEVFWQEVVASLDKLEKIYSLNDLDSFRMRYIATRDFLKKQHDFKCLKTVEIDENTIRILKKFNLMGYFNHRFSQIATSAEISLSREPLCETSSNYPVSQSNNLVLSRFRLKICMHIYSLVTKCWSDELYIDILELNFSQLACRIINRFADWLSKLRLSDFRKTGPATPESNRQTNFLAKQDAIMRLLIEECDRLVNSIREFISTSANVDPDLASIKSELFAESFIALSNGLGNVRSLQRLIEK